MKGKTLKKKTCNICKDKYQPFNTLQSVCSKPKCILTHHREKTRKAVKRSDMKRKQALKGKNELISDAQTPFNVFIRIRDKDEPCISCGLYDHQIPDKFTGGKWDCGHYLSRGAHTELRFNEDNAHKQCKVCNGGSGKFAKKDESVRKQYKINLIIKISHRMI